MKIFWAQVYFVQNAYLLRNIVHVFNLYSIIMY